MNGGRRVVVQEGLVAWGHRGSGSGPLHVIFEWQLTQCGVRDPELYWNGARLP